MNFVADIVVIVCQRIEPVNDRVSSLNSLPPVSLNAVNEHEVY